MTDGAKTQARAGNGGTIPPKERQFGQPNGNPRGRGFWKREDTPRYKLEQMMQRSETELNVIKADPDAPAFEKKLAACILAGEWKEIEGMINQVYGYPKQQVDQTIFEAPPSLSPRPVVTEPEKK